MMFLGRITYFLEIVQIIFLYGFIFCVHIKTTYALKQVPSAEDKTDGVANVSAF